MAPKSIATLPLLLLVVLFSFRCQSPGGAASRAPILQAAAKVGLVDVQAVAPGVVVDLRYATPRNVTGRPIYPADMPCLVERRTGEKLALAQREVAKSGYRIKIWDAYRPPRSHVALWRAAPDADYVVPPSVSLSMHCVGAAIDVTLVDAAGREVVMPTEFDHFSPRAAARYTGGDPEIARNLAVLQQGMRRAGFSSISNEWWHFWNPQAQSTTAISEDRLGIVLPPHVRSLPLRP